MSTSNAMIYIEFIEREPLVAKEIFRALCSQRAWHDRRDRQLGMLGRTMRLGPEPTYMSFVEFDDFSRFDEWEDYMRSPTGLCDQPLMATLTAARRPRAGCFDALVSGPPLDDGLLLVEFFTPSESASSDEIIRCFRTRDGIARCARLDFLLRRIALLGPDPGGMAIWRLADYSALGVFVREPVPRDVVTPVSMGIYRPFGREVL